MKAIFKIFLNPDCKEWGGGEGDIFYFGYSHISPDPSCKTVRPPYSYHQKDLLKFIEKSKHPPYKPLLWEILTEICLIYLIIEIFVLKLHMIKPWNSRQALGLYDRPGGIAEMSEFQCGARWYIIGTASINSRSGRDGACNTSLHASLIQIVHKSRGVNYNPLYRCYIYYFEHNCGANGVTNLCMVPDL